MIALGLDTSCYTTSFAAVDDLGGIVFDKRIPLFVPEGKKGLRQSEMVFMHVKNLSRMVDPLEQRVLCIGYSAGPRPQEGSYMPVFEVAKSFGCTLSGCLNVPGFELTHQHGHIGAALIGNELEGKVLALHVSGGTTEILRADITNGIVEDILLLGGTLDIAAGQLIDRIAQNMGLPFPGGEPLERLAEQGEAFDVKISGEGFSLNFSGLETQLFRALERGEKTADVCKTAEIAIARSLAGLINYAAESTGINKVLAFGGVMRNRMIRHEMQNHADIKINFAQIEYSSDNAVGIAMQALRRAKSEEEYTDGNESNQWKRIIDKNTERTEGSN